MHVYERTIASDNNSKAYAVDCERKSALSHVCVCVAGADESQAQSLYILMKWRSVRA